MASRYRTRATTTPTTRRASRRQQRERRLNRWVVAFGAAVLLLVAVIPIYGYFATIVLPPRQSAVTVNHITRTLGDVVVRTKADMLTAQGFGAGVQLATLPFEVLNTIAQEELLRQGAASEGIIISQEDIDAKLRDSYYPSPPAGEQIDPITLEKAYQENLRNYLNLTHFSETEHRNMIKAQLVRDNLRDKLSEQIPSVAEQVYTHWIKLTDANAAEQVTQRLALGDSFESLVRIYGQNDPYSDDNGEVGWVPRGAFRGLDPILFSIEHDVISEAVSSSEATYILKVTDGPVTSEINAKMREVLKKRAVEQWLNSQLDIQDVQVSFTSDDYAWVVDQVIEFAPDP